MPLTLKKLTQTALDNIMSHIPYGAKFSRVLEEAGYSKKLDGLVLKTDFVFGIDFSGCHFKNTSFQGEFYSSIFNNMSLDSVTFQNAKLPYSHFDNSTISNTTFNNSNFSHSHFAHTTFNHVNVKNTDFQHSDFTSSNIHNSLFSKTNLKNMHQIDNNVKNVHVIFDQPYQPDDVFHTAQTYQVKPTIALVDDAQWYSAPYQTVLEMGAHPQTLSQYNFDINDTQLTLEVKRALSAIHNTDTQSIAQQVIHSNQPLIQKIYNDAKTVMKNADALWIPGGPDLHPEFYAETNTHSRPNDSYYREILEFSLLEAAIQNDKPIFGVCHGSQLINVFLGGSLHQHVDGHHGYMNLSKNTHQGLLGEVIEAGAIAPSFHHQAVKKIAPTLEVVASANGVVKATQANDGKKIMATQYHPEHRADANSVKVLNKFFDLASEKPVEKLALQLKDVLLVETPHLLDTLTQGAQPTPTTGTQSVPAQFAHHVMAQFFDPMHFEHGII